MIADADIVIEAVFENLELKKEIFGRLDQLAKPGALLASNTSTSIVDAIANATSRPEDVDRHAFLLARQCHEAAGNRARRQNLATIHRHRHAAGKLLAKIPVVVGNCDGFVGNRMLARRTRGGTPAPGRRAAAGGRSVVQEFGFAMGPYAMGDLAGLDVGWRIRQHRGIRAPVSDALCELGRFGQKTGAGYYTYKNGSRVPVPDPWWPPFR